MILMLTKVFCLEKSLLLAFFIDLPKNGNKLTDNTKSVQSSLKSYLLWVTLYLPRYEIKHLLLIPYLTYLTYLTLPYFTLLTLPYLTLLTLLTLLTFPYLTLPYLTNTLVRTIGILRSLELNLESLHTDLESVHSSNGRLSACRIIKADETKTFTLVCSSVNKHFRADDVTEG